jgi:hypothetical protein
MPVRHVKPSALLQKHPNAVCTDCKKEADGDSEEHLWTIWTPTMYYCPKCAADEGIGPHDY